MEVGFDLNVIWNRTRRHCIELTGNANLPILVGLSPLHIAIIASDFKCVELLIHKSDVNCADMKQGRSPLQFAVEKRAADVVTLLLSDVTCLYMLLFNHKP